MAAKLSMKPSRKAVAELMLAMEIERRRKASLKLEVTENKSDDEWGEHFDDTKLEETQSEDNHFDIRTILLDMMNANKRSKLDPEMVAEYEKINMGDMEKEGGEGEEGEEEEQEEVEEEEVEVKQHKEGNKKRAPIDQSTDSENQRFSNCMRDAVRSICQICGSTETWNNMRNHTKKIHGIRITAYKQKYGQLTEHLVEKVFHKCGVCGRVLLLDPDILAPHVRNHGMSHKHYSAKYMTKRGVIMGVNSLRN